MAQLKEDYGNLYSTEAIGAADKEIADLTHGQSQGCCERTDR